MFKKTTLGEENCNVLLEGKKSLILPKKDGMKIECVSWESADMLERKRGKERNNSSLHQKHTKTMKK